MRSNSLFIIGLLGVLAFVLVAMLMIFVLDSYADAPQGNQPDLARQIREQFGFTLATADYESGKQNVLHLSFNVSADGKSGEEEAGRQMKEVSDFASEHFAPPDDAAYSISIIRREEYRSGCSRSMHVTTLRSKPVRPARNPYDLEPEEE